MTPTVLWTIFFSIVKYPLVFGTNEGIPSFSQVLSKRKLLHFLHPHIILHNFLALFCSQIFGLLPVRGILSKNVYGLKFEIFSFRTIYALLFILFYIIEYGLSIKFIIDTSFKFQWVGKLFYNAIGIMTGIYSVYLAVYWSSYMTNWYQKERTFLGPPYANKIKKGSLQAKINLYIVFMLTGAFCE